MANFPLTRTFLPFAAGLAATALTAIPGRAAENVALDFGPFSRSIPVESLAAYAEDGTVDDNLEPYLKLLTPERQEELKTVLAAEREADVVKLSRWFYAPMGERTLVFAGNLFPTGARQNGYLALRSALIASAAEDGAYSLLDIARNYSTDTLRINIPLAIQSTRQVIDEADATQALVEAVKQASQAEAVQNPLPANLPDLTPPGPYPVQQIDLTLQDTARQAPDTTQEGPRIYPATLLLPQDLSAIPGPLPVVVMSHGLGDTRTKFYDIARHVASHGFAVALPEHVGSNTAYREALFAGFVDEYFAATDFLDRPLDVTFLLDELERTNETSYQGKLDLDRVVIAGHSFGGYTALALSGATVDFERLAERCDPAVNIVLDPATVLECRALELIDDPEAVRQLGQNGVRDPRIKLVMAFSPVSNIFGEAGVSQIPIPAMIEGGAFDIMAPVVPQQVAAFSWLQTPEKYFYLAENTSHGPGFTGLTSRVFHIEEQFEQGIDEGLALSRNLNKSLIVAFSQVYLKGMEEFEPYLTAAYAEATSEAPFDFHLVRELPENFSAISHSQ